MATSGVTAFSNTARDYITQAMKEARILSSNGSPKASELVDMIFRLNLVLKSWQANGVNLWRETNGTLTIPGAQASGTLPVGVRDVTSARLVLSTYERPLAQITREEYNEIPNKDSVGSPSCYYVSRQRDAAEIYVWPVSATDMELKVDYDRIAETVTDGTETVDLPEEWADLLIATLAVRACQMFGAPLDAELAARYQGLERAMFDSDRPRSYFVGAY